MYDECNDDDCWVFSLLARNCSDTGRVSRLFVVRQARSQHVFCVCGGFTSAPLSVARIRIVTVTLSVLSDIPDDDYDESETVGSDGQGTGFVVFVHLGGLEAVQVERGDAMKWSGKT